MRITFSVATLQEFTVVRTPLVARIKGGSSRKVWVSDKSVVLDASSSYDPDSCNDVVNGCADTDMTFSWVCFQTLVLRVRWGAVF
jgi:hypothetical protein